jgi:hypothetical protein
VLLLGNTSYRTRYIKDKRSTEHEVRILSVFDLRKLKYIECSSNMILFLTFQGIPVSRLKYNFSI